LQEVYSRLGWKVDKSGRVFAPDPHKQIRGRRKSRHPSSKQRRKLQASSSDGLLLRSAEHVAKAECKSAPHETSRSQAEETVVARSKMSRTKVVKEKVAAAVHAALEQECLAMLSSTKETNEPPHVLGAQYMPLVQNGLRRQSSAPVFATAKRALERTRGTR
jgi:hypothetical protein